MSRSVVTLRYSSALHLRKRQQQKQTKKKNFHKLLVELVQLVSGAGQRIPWYLQRNPPKVPQSVFFFPSSSPFSVFQASFPLVRHGAAALTAHLVGPREPLAEAAAPYIHISAPAPPLISLTLPVCLTRVHTVIANSLTQAGGIKPGVAAPKGERRSEESADVCWDSSGHRGRGLDILICHPARLPLPIPAHPAPSVCFLPPDAAPI